MSVVYILLPVALVLGGGFLMAFIFSSLHGQYDDLETPGHRVLIDLEAIERNENVKEDITGKIGESFID